MTSIISSIILDHFFLQKRDIIFLLWLSLYFYYGRYIFIICMIIRDAINWHSKSSGHKLSKLFIIFGNLKKIISDRGIAFTSKKFREYYQNENRAYSHYYRGTAFERWSRKNKLSDIDEVNGTETWEKSDINIYI